MTPTNGKGELDLASYNQNFETFRALNALMWQVPLIGMTLTGGLWFGVATVSEAITIPFLRPGLLLIAGIGDVVLVVVLERLRYIIRMYLEWLKKANPHGHVEAAGDHLLNSTNVVKRCFQGMLGSAAVMSIVLGYNAMNMTTEHPTKQTNKAAVAWYDAHAVDLADGYEGLDSARTHPSLFDMLQGTTALKILDVGAGTGRDAAALAVQGHHVTAVDPSTKMLQLARSLHPNDDIEWLSDALPSLKDIKGTFDIVLLSAVWMHVLPRDRAAAFSRVVDLTAPSGRIYMTLRLGPGDVGRAIWTVSTQEIQRLATVRGLRTRDLGLQPDLLGRDDVKWQTLIVERPDK